MNNIDSNGLLLCKYQARLFVNSINQTNCSSSIFIKRFMNSDLARRIDNPGFIFASEDIVDAVNEIEFQYGESDYGTIKFSSEEMYWIGYIYRYWAYMYNLPSKKIYKIISSRELRKLYYPYHSLDPEQVIERIMEEKETIDKTNIDYAVQVLRKIRNKK